MSEIHYVTVQIAPPGRSYPYGKIEEGFYKVEGDTVCLVTRTGAPRYDTKRKPITHKLRSGETARAVAWRLTKQNIPNKRGDFNRPIHYFNPGKI